MNIFYFDSTGKQVRPKSDASQIISDVEEHNANEAIAALRGLVPRYKAMPQEQPEQNIYWLDKFGELVGLWQRTNLKNLNYLTKPIPERN